MQRLYYDLNDEKVQYLIRSNRKLGKLIKYIGSNEIVIEDDGFKCIVKYVVGQQISDKARETIWQRICTTYKNITPKKMLSIKNDDLRRVGLSERKVVYIKTLATATLNKEIDFVNFPKFTNEEIIKRLTSLKGIGQWTADKYDHMNKFIKADAIIVCNPDGIIGKGTMFEFGFMIAHSKRIIFTNEPKGLTISFPYEVGLNFD